MRAAPPLWRVKFWKKIQNVIGLIYVRAAPSQDSRKKKVQTLHEYGSALAKSIVFQGQVQRQH